MPESTAVGHHKNSLNNDCTCFISRNHHHDSKGEECTCKIDMNHNTKPSPHKDADGRPCSGPFRVVSPIGKRFCEWCRREESYSVSKIIIVFKKNITAIEAVNFVINFRLNNYALALASGNTEDIIEKNGLVAVTALVPLAAGKLADEWIAEIEKSERIWFASRVMVVHYPSQDYTTAATKPKQEKNKTGHTPDFPDELQEV